MPLTSEEKLSEQYEAGISCPYCYEKLTEDKRESLRERQKQVKLAKVRGQSHIGDKQKN
jgi:UPF0176 protein